MRDSDMFIEELISVWHEMPEEQWSTSSTLPEFLRMSNHEYKRYVETNEVPEGWAERFDT